MVDGLRESEIYVSEMFTLYGHGLASVVEDSDSLLIVAHLSKNQLFHLLADDSFTEIDKLLIWVPTEGDALTEQEQLTLLPPDSKIRVILIFLYF